MRFDVLEHNGAVIARGVTAKVAAELLGAPVDLVVSTIVASGSVATMDFFCVCSGEGLRAVFPETRH